jgi:hypothetical protein
MIIDRSALFRSYKEKLVRKGLSFLSDCKTHQLLDTHLEQMEEPSNIPTYMKVHSQA